MERVVRATAGLSEAEAALVVEIAKSQARLLGGTENYVVTREFKSISTPEQRGRLLECLFEIAAADGTIETVESAEIAAIGEEIGFTRPEINALRAALSREAGGVQGALGPPRRRSLSSSTRPRGAPSRCAGRATPSCGSSRGRSAPRRTP